MEQDGTGRGSARQNVLAALFRIQAGEGRVVLALLFLYVFLGLAVVLVQSAAFALFLSVIGSQGLPYAYMVIAIAVSLVSFIYLRLANRLPVSQLLVLALCFLLAGTLAFRLGLLWLGARWLFFALPIWFQCVVNLALLVFWTMAGRIFDVRQGKRLFGLVGSGYWIAAVAGGFLVSAVVGPLGTPNLLLLAAGSLAVALVLQHGLLRAHADRFAASNTTPDRQYTADASPSARRYVTSIFTLVLLWWVGFIFIENIFYNRASAQYAAAAQLASVIGVMFVAQGVLALLTNAFLTGRIMGRYGLRGGLLIVPSTCLASIGALALTGTLGATGALLFLLAALARLVSVALGLSLEQTSFVILYQPLAPEQRIRVQSTAEGIVQPVAVGLAGALFLVFHTLFSFGAVQMSYLFLVIGAGWILMVLMLVRTYPLALARALAKRQLSGTPVSVADEESRTVLSREARNPRPHAALYALQLLEQTDPAALAAVLPSALEHPAPEVQQVALHTIERLGLVAAGPAVSRCLAEDTSPPVRVAALRALAALGEPGALERIAAYLDDPDPQLRCGAMVGLLRSGGIEETLIAGQTLLTLVASSDPIERALAAQVIGEVGARSFYRPLLPLLHDGDPRVRRAALRAAGQVKHPRLWPLVVEALAPPSVREAAALALIDGGEEALPAIEAAFASADQPGAVRVRLARVCGRIGGERALALLRGRIGCPDVEERAQVLSALSACGYRADSAAGRIWEQIKVEVADAAWSLSARADLGDGEPVRLLAAALEAQVQAARERLLYLLSFLLDARAILQAREVLVSPSGGHRAYAIEYIDSQLTPEWKGYLLPVLDELPLDQRLRRLSAVFPLAVLGREGRLRAIITGAEGEPWVRACALYAATRLPEEDWVAAVATALDAPQPLVRETARWALDRLDPQDRSSLSQYTTDQRVLYSPTEQKGGTVVLSTLERVMILKTVSIFARTPDDVLAAVAAILDEVDVRAGDTIFEQGDPGSSMYVVVSGKMRAHIGDHTLNELGERDVFGEMALLDPKPRMATVSAVEDTHLFRLDEEPFYELMADRSEVARGIIGVLTARLRKAARERARLHAQLQHVQQDAAAPPLAAVDLETGARI